MSVPEAQAAPAEVAEKKVAKKVVKKKTVKKVAKKKAVKKVAKKKAVKKVAKKKTTRRKGTRTWRFAIIKSPKGREVTPRVSKTGQLSTRAAKRLGMKVVPKWGRVQADTRQAALKILRAGGGEWFTKAKGEPA